MTDLELINHIIDGARIGFNQLIRKWGKKIYNFVFRYLGNKELAFDITQKTFDRPIEPWLISKGIDKMVIQRLT